MMMKVTSPFWASPQLHGKRILKLLQKIFSWLPLATVIDQKVLVLHGGISDITDLNILARLDRHNVWSCDPIIDFSIQTCLHPFSFHIGFLRFCCLLFPVRLSPEASEEETPELGWDVHRLRHGWLRHFQQHLPTPGLTHIPQTPRNPWHLPEPLAAGLLGPHQGDSDWRVREPQEKTVTFHHQHGRKRHKCDWIVWVCEQRQFEGWLETGD